MKLYLQSKCLLLTAAIFCFSAAGTFAQHTVSGTVFEASTSDPLPGVNVMIKGTTTGTSTDADGTYQLVASSSSDTLAFSFVGYQTQEIPIDGRTEIDISLKQQTHKGEYLVVVGYGTQTEGELTSSVSSVGSEDFKTGNVNDAGALIQGKVPGLTVTIPSGDPTSGSEIRLRGNTTLFGANSDPLVLIDRSEEHTSELQSRFDLVFVLVLH